MFNFFKKKSKNENSSSSDTLNNKETSNKSFWEVSFSALKKTLSKTTENLVGNVLNFVEQEEELNDFVLDDMEDLLIKADLGVSCASAIVDKIRISKIKPAEIKNYLQQEFSILLENVPNKEIVYKENALNIYLITGVNGAGKTTFIGKLANRLRLGGKKVLICAADTFRAAAEEQLEIWSKRAEVDIIRKDGADPASVVFDAIKKAQNENYNVLLIDTAGRLQNKFNLMEELKKIKSVINKLAPDSLEETLLVLDANTGQNGLQQAKIFQEAVSLTGVVLTKLDGSAKGGIVIAIAKELNLPVKMIGVGEQITDIKDFNSQIFVKALFE